MDLSFGARLRLHRERQQVPLSVVAEQTKIKASLLDGLERDDLSHWPGGIFRRSYVRAYAHAIGLEPESVVEEFLDRYPEPAEDLSGALTARADEDPHRRPPTRLGFLISSAISALPPLRRPPGRAAEFDRPRRHDMPSFSAALHDPADVPSPDLFPAPPTPDLAAPEVLDLGPMTFATQADADEVPEAGGSSSEYSDSMRTAAPGPDLTALARLCTRLGCVVRAADLTAALADAARLLDAAGLTLWTWEPASGGLRPALSHGYPEALIAQLPRVRPEADNAIAWAYRTGEPCLVEGGAHESGAVTVPVVTPAGCAGVLALEFRDGAEQRGQVQAVAAILAAQLSTLVAQPAFAQAVTA